MTSIEFPSADSPKSIAGFVPSQTHKLFSWITDGRQWLWARKLSRATLKMFTAHPAETRETYFQHLWFTLKTSLRFGILSVIIFLHGVFPFLFKRTASRQIERIYLMMRSRIPEARREILKAEYDI